MDGYRSVLVLVSCLAMLILAGCGANQPQPESTRGMAHADIELPELSESERAEANRGDKPGRVPAQAGVARKLPSAQAHVPLHELSWEMHAEVARAELTLRSPGASGSSR
jgi:hypothetical protein